MKTKLTCLCLQRTGMKSVCSLGLPPAGSQLLSMWLAPLAPGDWVEPDEPLVASIEGREVCGSQESTWSLHPEALPSYSITLTS